MKSSELHLGHPVKKDEKTYSTPLKREAGAYYKFH